MYDIVSRSARAPSCRGPRSRRRRRQRRAGAIALLLAASACGSPDPLSPNLVLLTSEIRNSDLACFDGTGGAGEALCGLASAGARCSWRSGHTSTAAFVGTLLTSRPAAEHGLGESAAAFLASDALTAAEILMHAGYHTGAVVTAPELNRSRNFQQGFGTYVDRPAVTSTNDLVDNAPARAATDAALQWARGARAPWFLWVHYRADPVAVDREVSHLVRGLDDLGVDPGVLFTGTGTGPSLASADPIASDWSPAIPLLWRSPDKRPISAGPADCEIEAADLTATLLTAADQPIPERFRGKALFFADWRNNERRISATDAPIP